MRGLANGLADDALAYAVRIITAVCERAGDYDFVDHGKRLLEEKGVVRGVRHHDTAVIFDWLMFVLSFQGIADRVAEAYIEQYGNVIWDQVSANLSRRPSCPKLIGYWAFDNCRYTKWSTTCSAMDHVTACPVPTHPLRNGRLNQTAYSLFLFMRDVANGDFVAWIDRQIRPHRDTWDAQAVARASTRLIAPLTGIYGVSDKVMTMAMSCLLLGGGRRQYWPDVGATMIVIDTLVHNFLHRTGILDRLQEPHAYGPACYGPNGCADIVRQIAGHIDARRFNPAFPATFPRFVQLAIWRYCAEREMSVCNGNRIDDRARCANDFCQLFAACDRIALKKSFKISDL